VCRALLVPCPLCASTLLCARCYVATLARSQAYLHVPPGVFGDSWSARRSCRREPPCHGLLDQGGLAQAWRPGGRCEVREKKTQRHGARNATLAHLRALASGDQVPSLLLFAAFQPACQGRKRCSSMPRACARAHGQAGSGQVPLCLCRTFAAIKSREGA
jgi:hypothetical protein